MPDTYEPYLSNLIEYINTNKTNPNAKILWHMTWAYQQDSTHSAFPNYNSDQLTMYNAIVNAMKTQVYPHSEIDFVIPVGTVIQNARTSLYGDKLTRDGYHLGNQQGRYIAGLTWYHKITGMPIDNMKYAPNDTLLMEYQQKIMTESIYNAVQQPEQVTQSRYIYHNDCFTRDNDYIKLDLEPKIGKYWNSTKAAGSIYDNASWIATKKFSKTSLPQNAFIVLDAGYQYRPEGWEYVDKKYTGTRPALVENKVVKADDSWWGVFNYRAFNIGRTDGAKITADELSHFGIYVPKSDYTELDWEPNPNTYYWSTENPATYLYTTGDNAKHFISSKLFSKDELPNGTIIVIDKGYQYRPDGWQNLTDKNTNERPANVTGSTIIVDDSWWSDYNYRGFNIAVEGAKTDITNIADEVASHFRIYVPKSTPTEE